MPECPRCRRPLSEHLTRTLLGTTDKMREMGAVVAFPWRMATVAHCLDCHIFVEVERSDG